MFFCNCRPKPGQEQIDLINAKPEPCKKHKGREIHFVCKGCLDNPLLCDECIEDHHGHDWMNLKQFFTPDVVELFSSGQSRNGLQVDQTVTHLQARLAEYSQNINAKIKETQLKILDGLQRLKSEFPLQGGYHIEGDKLTNQSMRRVIQIVKNQEQSYNSRQLQKTFEDILQVSEDNINHNLNKMLECLENHRWETVDQEQLYALENNYLAYFKKEPENLDFYFSATEKNPNIRLEHRKKVAVYTKEIPKLPAILTEKPFTPNNNKIYFKIIAMEKTLKIFDMSKVFVGVCIPEMAQLFSYLNLSQASKGAYLISSEGRAYHSKLPEYHDSRSHFSFGKGDVIEVGVDYEKGTVFFQKKNSKIKLISKFQMRLALDDAYMRKLKPCVMFGKEIGAEVAIFTKQELEHEGSSFLSTTGGQQKKSIRGSKAGRSRSKSRAATNSKNTFGNTFKSGGTTTAPTR